MMNWHISPPHLIFAEPLGTTPDGNYIYRFLFSEEPEVVWGDKFNITPASAVHGLHPSPETISEEWRVVSPIQLLTAVESDWFSMQDCIDGIIALVFSTDDETSVLLHFGDQQIDIRDLFDKKKIFHQKITYTPPIDSRNGNE